MTGFVAVGHHDRPVLSILVVLVVIHEFGHFVTARRAGVRVHEFGIGFPPRAKVLRAKGETIYTLNWLPIGGFVRLEGEDGESRRSARVLVEAAAGRASAILLAGVVMNFLLAFVIFTGHRLPRPIPIDRRPGRHGPARLAGRGGRRPGRRQSLATAQRRARSAPSTRRRPWPSTACASHVRRRRSAVGARAATAPGTYTGHADRCARPAEVDAKHGRARRSAPIDASASLTDPARSIQYTPVEAVAIGVQRTVDASTLILARPRRAGPFGRDQPDQPAGLRPGRHRRRRRRRRSAAAAASSRCASSACCPPTWPSSTSLPFPPLDGGRC